MKALSVAAVLGMAVSAFAAHAQYGNPGGPGQYGSAPYAQAGPQGYSAPARDAAGAQVFDAAPAQGIYVRSDVSNGIATVSNTPGVTELRVVQGRADVTVHHPADHTQILVDLPGGQVALLKDGLYTFNAESRTVRVLHGEAEAYNGSMDNTKGAKVKETQELALLPNVRLKAVDSYPYELTADLLAAPAQERGDGGFPGGGPYEGFAGYGYPYGYGFYPYGFYPAGYGYPFGFGLGFGYYGGFGGYRGGFGGYRGGFGGFRGGFHR